MTTEVMDTPMLEASPSKLEPDNNTENNPPALEPFRLISPTAAIPCSAEVPLVTVAPISSVITAQDTEDNLPRQLRKRKIDLAPTRDKLDRAAKHRRPGERREPPPPPPEDIMSTAIVPIQPSQPFRLVPIMAVPDAVATVGLATKLDVMYAHKNTDEHSLSAMAKEADARVVVTVIPKAKWTAKGDAHFKTHNRAWLSNVPFEWSPGITLMSGINYVSPLTEKPALPPVVIKGELPGRWKPPPSLPIPVVEKTASTTVPTKKAPSPTVSQQQKPAQQKAQPQQQQQKQQPSSSQKPPKIPRPPSATKLSRKGGKKTPRPVVSSEIIEPIVFSKEKDPLAASLEFIQAIGRSMGRLPLNQSGFTAELDTQQSRIAHALLARDGRTVGKPKLQATRRSVRVRQAPESFVPTPSSRPLSAKSVRDAEGKEAQPSGAATDIRVGPNYECPLPVLRRKPTEPTETESRYLGELLTTPGEVGYSVRRPFAIASVQSVERRAEMIATRWQGLAAALGPERAVHFGLGNMGATNIGNLTEEEQEGIYKGMKEHGRDFIKISKEFVPTKTPEQLVEYYYDVWKLRLVPAAQRWYDDKAAEEEALEREYEAEQKKRQEDAARRAERQEQAYKRRMMREALAWVRNAAKTTPTEVNWNKAIVRERAGRVVDVLHELKTGKRKVEDDKVVVEKRASSKDASDTNNGKQASVDGKE